jgi:Na+-translocating ferredoxin:NAD+ oxidoreductase RnfA subunit
MGLKRFLFALVLILISSFVNANNEIEMADQFRADGKIYIVIAVISIVFAGFIGFTIYLDNKISKIEKKINS